MKRFLRKVGRALAWLLLTPEERKLRRLFEQRKNREQS
jgi:hypothetical protein